MSKSAHTAPLDLASLVRLLRALLHLRSALAPFRADVQALLKTAEDVPPSLLASWRLCQERLDHLLDAAPEGASWAVQMRLMGQEMEDNLIDATHNLAALFESAQALEETGEAGLLEIERTLSAAVAGPGLSNERQGGA